MINCRGHDRRIDRFHFRYYFRYSLLIAIFAGTIYYLGYLIAVIIVKYFRLVYEDVDLVRELIRGLGIGFFPAFVSFLTAIHVHRLLRLRYWIVLLITIFILYYIISSLHFELQLTIYGYVFRALFLYLELTISASIGISLSRTQVFQKWRKRRKTISYIA